MRTPMVVLVGLLGCGPGGAVVIDDPTGTQPTEPTGTGPIGTEPTSPTGPTGTEPTGEASDYRTAGPFEVNRATDELRTSCDMRYTRFLPAGRTPSALVILAHGFSRSRDQVADLAEHLAGWGVAVVTPDLCAADLWNADHERNADDLVALADALSDGGPVVYAGHSAGGLAGFLAAVIDPAAAGAVGLDLVDSGDLAADLAGAVTVPTWGLVGEPEACNEDNNALPVYAAVPGARVLRVNGADHCDFESPTDFFCTAFCADGGGPDGPVRSTIEGLATAAILATSGTDPLAVQWWTPGADAYDQLLAAGAISGP